MSKSSFLVVPPHEKIASAHPVLNYLGGTRLFLLICNNDSCTIPRKIDENTNWNIIWLNQSGLVQFFLQKQINNIISIYVGMYTTYTRTNPIMKNPGRFTRPTVSW